MGGAGTNSHARDLSRLTPQEREVYEWACAEVRVKRYPGLRSLRVFLGCRGGGLPHRLRLSIMAKVGWPCPVRCVRSGTHSLTPVQREILTTAWDLWERTPREDPTLATLQRVMARVGSSDVFVKTRRICLALKIWPCRVRKPPLSLTDEETTFLVTLKRAGSPDSELPSAFQERFGRRPSTRTIHRVLRRAGVVNAYRKSSPRGIEVRKALVIAQRKGFAPSNLQEPAAYRRALRRAKRPRPLHPEGHS